MNSILVAVKLISGLISSKSAALFLGPSGLALLGNFKNFLQTTSSFTAEGYQNGIIRYSAEYRNNQKQLTEFIITIFQLSLMISILIGFIIFFTSDYWAYLILKDLEFSYVFKTLSICLPFFSFNLLYIYVLNGLQRFRKLVLINSILSLSNMLVLIFLIYSFKLSGALIATVASSLLVFLINLILLKKDKYVLFHLFNLNYFSFKVLKNMSGYLFMSFYSYVITSVSLLIVRNLIITKINLESAGYWEAMNRISSFYTMFFISLTSLYLLPKLSEINDWKSFKLEMKSFYKFVIPLLTIALVFIFILRIYLLRLLLSEEFMQTATLFKWQLLGDFIAVISIALVKQFHAKRLIKYYLVSNGLLNLLYIIFSFLLIDFYGIQGVVKAYAISYFIYFFIIMFLIIRFYKNQHNREKAF
ncbi:O-antigen translocase [Mesonia sp. JHPTF-M18]|uniref:O-antigen translocase n=1 Tax=Mesonia aestuariivivens TaxID=2796128 RepID=A0ABS6VZ61_9FLAO|nr:O-antigen translocase [Mesonia aestuariivivens]